MQYPLIDRGLLADLRLAHGAYNFVVMLLFLYQGWIGMQIRRTRTSGHPLPFSLIRKHRRTGPVLAVMCIAGFVSGIALVLVATGKILEHVPHLTAGCLLVLALAATYAISRRIKGQDPAVRTDHVRAGSALLILYGLDLFLGVGVLL